MTELGPSLKIKEKSLLLWRARPCSALQSTRQTPPWVSPIRSCCHPRSSSGAAEITSIGLARNAADYLDWALDGFSGSSAADELDDGPFCILSIVDTRAFKRLCYEVLDHDPAHGDIRAFFRRFQTALTRALHASLAYDLDGDS